MDKGVALIATNWILAFLPIFVLLCTILFFKWGAPKAGGISWFVAILIGMFFFGADSRLLTLANSKGLSLSLYVVLIIWCAVFLYNIVNQIGAIKVIGDTMRKVTEDRLLQCLIMAWCFTSFMQGIAGFGVPIAVVAPIMVVMGFTPVVATATCLVGYCWSISFGSMASSYYTIQLVTKIPGEIIGPWMAILFIVPIIATGFATAFIYGGMSSVRRGTPAILVTSVVISFTCWLMNVLGAAQLATLIPAIMGCCSLAVMSRTSFYRTKEAWQVAEKYEKPTMGFHMAFSPYYILIFLSVLSQIKSIAEIFKPYSWGLNYPAVQTTAGFVVKAEIMYSRINIFSHPAPFLLMAALLGYFIFEFAGKWKAGVALEAFHATFKQCVPTSIGIVTMVMMALVMNDAGMTNLLAKGMAHATGSLFPVVSPFIGVLGSFLTGSNTNSNIMFGGLQVETANQLGDSVVIMAAAQSVGGSVGCSVAPNTVLLGTTTVGLAGREGEVMKLTLPYCLAITLLVGISAWIYSHVLF
jgi:lactate permease